MNTEKQRNGTGNPTRNQGISPPPGARIAWRVTVCLLTLAGSLHLAQAATSICGPVSGGHWTTNGSPYVVTCDVQVYGTLTIDPGVVVRFDGNYEFQAGGQLHVNGTTNDYVYFKPVGTNCWKGIAFVDAVPGSYFNGTIIEGACQSGVRITNTPPAFTNCIIRNNYSPTHGGGILADLSPALTLVMNYCHISNNLAGPYNSGGIYGGGIYVDGSLLLVQSTVKSNRTRGVSGYGGGIFAVNGDCTMQNCTIAFNAANATSVDTAGGIYYSDSSGKTLQMANCSMDTNGIRNANTDYGGGGLLVYQGKAKLVNCISRGNASQGLRFHAGQASVVNCTVVANEHQGIYSDGASAGVTNCIVYFNYNNGDQIGGSVTVRYSDVQGSTVEPGEGNINYSPGLCPNYSLNGLSTSLNLAVF